MRCSHSGEISIMILQASCAIPHNRPVSVAEYALPVIYDMCNGDVSQFNSSTM